MKRGEIWVVNLEPGFGREIHKKRPCLVISSNNINQHTHNVIVIPTSFQVPRVIGSEMIPVGKVEGLDKNSVLLPVFIRSIDRVRLIKKIGKISSSKMEEVDEAMGLILEMEE